MMSAVDKAIKIHSKYGKTLHWLLFFLFIALVFGRLENFNWTVDLISFSEMSALYLSVAIGLTFLNWYLEFQKWRISIPVNTNNKKQAFFAGMISGFVTPSYAGNFIGRSLKLEGIRKRQVVSLTLAANFSQFATTLFFGLIGLILFKAIVLPDLSLLWLIILLLLTSAIVGLFVQLEKVKWASRLIVERDLDVGNRNLRVRMLSLSSLRYFVFSLQFLLVFMAFSADVDWNYFWAIWVMYLLMSISPSLISGKLLVRESIAVFVFSALGEPVSTILLVAVLVWFVNNVLPTAIAFLMLRRNVS